jgi:hypothetical protein
MKQYPFRFYGREPADWSMSDEGFLYDVQFSEALDASTKEAVRAIAERQFSRGPAAVGEVWYWGSDRFLVLSLRPRFEDAARMIFTQVAEFLAVLNQTARIRDVVFCNGVGARADRWDAWSLKQSPQPDPGPRRPNTPWAKLLKRPQAGDLEYAPAPAPQRREARAKPASLNGARKENGPHAEPHAQPQTQVHRTRVEALPVSEAEELALAGWSQLAAAFPDLDLARIEGPSIPIGWVRVGGRNVALVCFNASGVPQRIEIPDGGGSVHLAVDPHGLVAVTHNGNTIYTVNVPEGTARARMAIHENNGPVAAIAWAADDLWALRMTSQFMFFDLSEKDHLYVGTQQPQGSLAGLFRHGTLAAFHDGSTLRFVGVCDWQFKELASLGAPGCALRVVDDELYLTEKGKVSRVDGIDEVYEAWAAPLRRRAEEDRTRRVQPPAEGVRWRAVTEDEMPPDREKARREALVKKFGVSAWAHIHDDGDAVVVQPRTGFAVSRGARIRRCPAKGRARYVKSAKGAWNSGVTCFSMDPAREVLFYVAGATFGVHRVDLAEDHEETCTLPGFSTRSGLLFDVVALDRKNFLSIWNDTLDWHRPKGERWEVLTKVALDLPRGNAFDRASRRLALTQQSRERLMVLHLGDDGFTRVASCTDAVKLMTFREGRLFAQMIDGQWFELLGIDAAPTA